MAVAVLGATGADRCLQVGLTPASSAEAQRLRNDRWASQKALSPIYA
jgi:hypothetical protein